MGGNQSNTQSQPLNSGSNYSNTVSVPVQRVTRERELETVDKEIYEEISREEVGREETRIGNIIYVTITIKVTYRLRKEYAQKLAQMKAILDMYKLMMFCEGLKNFAIENNLLEDAKDEEPLKVPKGQVTFDAEGQDSGPFFSRRFHVPSGYSGATIGRGCDLKEKDAKTLGEISKIIGIPFEKMKKLQGLKGWAAKEMIKELDLDQHEITHEQQKELFKTEYEWHEKDTKRIVDKNTGDAQVWEKCHPKIKEILTDLRFRGDFTPQTRLFLMDSVKKNDYNAFKKVMADNNNWKNVPSQRFKARVQYLEKNDGD